MRATKRLRFLLRERDVRGRPNEQVLSVYRDHGVVPKNERTDNYNKTPIDTSGYKLTLPNDVVVNKMKAWQGSVAVSRHRGIVSGDYLVCSIVDPQVDPRYIHYALRSSDTVSKFRLASTGVRPSQWRLYWDDFADIAIPLPTIAQQQAIADFLEAETARIDALIEKKRRLIEMLSERRVAVVQRGVAGSAFEHRRSTTVPWLRDLPQEWNEAQLKLVATLGTGHTPSRNNDEYWRDCTIPWVTTGEVARLRSDEAEYLHATEHSISQLGLANSAAVVHPAGTVFLSRTASAGFSGIIGRDMATSQDFVTWTCGKEISPRYLLLCLRAMRDDLLGRLAQGSTHKTVYMPDVESIRIPLPPRDVQEEIAQATWRECKTIDEVIVRTRRQNVLLSERRRALITSAVTGHMEAPGMGAV